jgi:hypothetical protein
MKLGSAIKKWCGLPWTCAANNTAKLTPSISGMWYMSENEDENEELLKESESFLELLDQTATMTAETRVALKNTLASIKKQRKDRTL